MDILRNVFIGDFVFVEVTSLCLSKSACYMFSFLPPEMVSPVCETADGARQHAIS